MNHTPLASAALALALAGCTPQSPAHAAAPVPRGPGKPSAPVTVSAELSPGAARVTVRFDADAKNVAIEVYGAGGLTVTSAAAPVQRTSFARGETAAFDVAFTPGPGQSDLAVAVTGIFHGAGRRGAVASFAVGEPSAEQRAATGTVVEGSDGERLKVVVPGK